MITIDHHINNFKEVEYGGLNCKNDIHLSTIIPLNREISQKVLRNNLFLLILSSYIIAEENKYRCDDNRREQHYTPRERACKKLLDEKTNVGKFTEICAAAMAILAIAIFTGIFLLLLIMFSNLGEKW